jgi:hypothetical protein
LATLLAILAVAMTTMVVAPPAIATTDRSEDTFTTFGCDDTVSAGRSWLYLYEAGESTSVGGPFIDAELSVGRTYMYTAYGEPGTGSVVDNGDGTISVDVAQPAISGRTGEVVGTLAISATLATSGDPYTVNEREHSPGYGYSVSGTLQDLTLVSGTAMFGSTTFTLPTSCHGRRGTLIYTETYPDAYNEHSSYRYVSCELDAGHGVVGFLDAYQEGSYSDLYLFVQLSRRSWVEGYTDTFEYTDDALNASFPVEGDSTGTATVAATLTPTGEIETTTYISEGGYDKYTRALSSVAGSLVVALDDGKAVSFDLAGCGAAETTYRLHYTSPSGPKPGPAPVNDLPENAIQIGTGTGIAVDTSGAATDAEETSCDPLGQSVWYTVAGTGAEMTFDTTGTDFDTMVAVYTKSRKGFQMVACVDDVDSSTPYQSIVSFGTKSKTMYWIQTGGFAEQGGNLVATLT